MQAMFVAPKASAAANKTGSFIVEWSERKLSTYEDEYGGERTGVPKGEDIPFPPHKVKAAVALLAYGAPNHETLTAIARTVRVSGALLRIWRTEERFLALYRRAVWECVDAFIPLLAASWDPQRLSPAEEFQSFFGVALQQGIFRRLWVDVLESEWEPRGLKPKWLAECSLVGLPRSKAPRFADTRLLLFNTYQLLSTIPFRLGTREPGLATLVSHLLMRELVVKMNLKDLRTLVENGKQEEAIGIIDWLTAPSPLDNPKALNQLLMPATRSRKKR